jgi:hypothetical protein
MGQTTAGTALVANSAATSRKIGMRFRCDWEEDGFGSEVDWTDESAYVLSVSGTMEAIGMRKPIAAVGRGVANVVRVVCQNPECTGGDTGFRFSPSNSNGSLYAFIGEGAVHMKRAQLEMAIYDGAVPERLAQITGYIVNLTENYKARTVSFEIRDRAADAVMTRASTTLQAEKKASEYMEVLAALFDRDAVAGGDQEFDDGMTAVPYYWLEDEKLWDECGDVAEAHLGRVWFDKDGDLHFDDGSHFVKPNTNAWDDPTTSQATFTTASFAECNPVYAFDSIYNHIIVEYQPRYTGYSQDIFTASDVVRLYPSEANKSYHAKFDYPSSGVTTPVSGTDFTAITSGAVGVSVTVSINATYAASAELYLTNNSASWPACFTELRMRGSPLLTQEPVKYECEDAASVAAYGRRTWTIRNNPYVQTYRHAQMVGDFLLNRFKDPVQTIELKGVPARPWLEVGDRVTVTEALTDISEDYWIGKIGWRWSPKTTYTQDLSLMRIADMFSLEDYFIIGTSKLGTGADHGHLFW